MQDNVYLIGLMGSGKTTIGRRLAALSQKNFVDTDQALEQRTGVSVSCIFEIEGELGFRQRESVLLQEIAQQTNQIIATGGGIILNPDNCKTMQSSGVVVYLKIPQNTLWQRLYKCKNRPLLQTKDPESTLKKLMQQRHPLYLQAADEIIKVGKGSAAKTAQQIYHLLQHANRKH